VRTALRRVSKIASVDAPIQITVANVASMVLSFMTVPVVALAIGADGRGQTAAVVAAYVFVPVVLGLGLPLEVRRRSTGGVNGPAVRAVRDIVLLTFAPAVVVAAILASTVYSVTDESVRWLALIGIAAGPITVSWAVDIAALVGAGRYRAVFLMRVTQPALVLATMVPFWLCDILTPVSVLVMYQVSSLATAVLGFFLVRTSFAGERANRMELLRAGFKYAGSAVAESASARLDQIIVLPLIGATQTGYYTLATSISVLPIAVSHALAAKHFREMATAAPQDARRIGRNGLHQCASLAAPFALLIGVSGIWVIPAVFGAEFEPSVSVLLILSVASFATAVSYVGSMLLAARGRGGVMTGTQAGALGIDLILLIPLATHFAAHGAAWASSVAYIFLVGMQMIALRVPLSALVPTPRGVRAGVRSLAR
jgi:O-antigen/teichoic acid export membrane protein